MTNEDMSGQNQDGTIAAASGRYARRVNEPLFTGLDVAAFAVALIMVCGPLAFGALGL